MSPKLYSQTQAQQRLMCSWASIVTMAKTVERKTNCR